MMYMCVCVAAILAQGSSGAHRVVVLSRHIAMAQCGKLQRYEFILPLSISMDGDRTITVVNTFLHVAQVSTSKPHMERSYSDPVLPRDSDYNEPGCHPDTTLPLRVNESLPSIGSENHTEGGCRGRCFHFIKGTCSHGYQCEFCHLPHQRKSKPGVNNREKIARRNLKFEGV